MSQTVKEPVEISEREAELIFDKLTSERIPVTAWLTSASGASVFLLGLLERFSPEHGFFVRAHPSEFEIESFLMVSVRERTVRYEYCDESELRDMPQEIKDAIGATAVEARFQDPLETLTLIFKI